MMNLLTSIFTILIILPLSLQATKIPSRNPEAPPSSSERDPGRVSLGKKLQHRVQKISRSELRKYENIAQKSCHRQSQYVPTYPIKGVSPAGKTMTLSDETVFEVAPSYAHIAARWPKSSKVIIRPNKTWFSWLSRYNFRLQNVTTQEVVEADLAQGPFVKYATFINIIDQGNGFLLLSDGSTWKIDPSQSSQLQQWQSGQAVLFGENSAWYGAPYVLININKNEYIPVSCY